MLGNGCATNQFPLILRRLFSSHQHHFGKSSVFIGDFSSFPCVQCRFRFFFSLASYQLLIFVIIGSLFFGPSIWNMFLCVTANVMESCVFHLDLIVVNFSVDWIFLSRSFCSAPLARPTLLHATSVDCCFMQAASHRVESARKMCIHCIH